MDRPGLVARTAHSCRRAGVDTLAHLPSSHLMVSALRPSIALQVLSAMTATPLEISTTFLTPGTAMALEPSKLATLPPKTGQRSSEAYSMPGRLTSSPNPIEPLTFAGVSRRLGEVPITLYCAAVFSGTFVGGVTLAAASASAP